MVSKKDLKVNDGAVFWVNNSSIPSEAFEKLSLGLSNDKVSFNGLVKTGISEMLAV